LPASAAQREVRGIVSLVGRTLLLSFLGAPFLVACGDDTECVIDTDCPIGRVCVAQSCVPPGGEVDAGPLADGGGFDGDVPADAGPADGGGFDAGMPDAGPPISRTGLVNVRSERVVPGGTPTDAFTASVTFTVFEGISPCSTEDLDDACSVTVCEDTSTPPMDAGVPPDAGPDAGPPFDAGPPGDAGPPPAIANAGTVQVNGGLMALTFMPDAMGRYTAQSGASLIWMDPSTILTFQSAADAPVPAFMGQLHGAEQVTLTTPAAPPAGMSFDFDQTTDLAVTWNRAPGDFEPFGVVSMGMSFAAAAPSTASVSVSCRWPIEAGEGTVPAAALAMFPAGSIVPVSWNTEVDRVLEPGDGWEVEIQTTAVSRYLDGRAAVGMAMITDPGAGS